MSPKVFLSHASDDKDRFVFGFATKLRDNGIDVWLDKWEMLPGDSLVEKIFEEGLKNAQAVIIVLSKFSVNKPWVKEELNASVVNKISKGTRIIPVIIDECEVPESLRSTLWEKVENITSYQDSLERIIAAIFGTVDRPTIGPAPLYTSQVLANVPGLNQIDNIVLKSSCEYDLEKNAHFLNPVEIFIRDGKLVVPENELKDSLEILDRNGHIKLTRTRGSGFANYQITVHGMEEYLNAYKPDYQELIRKIIALIVNNNMQSNSEIVSGTHLPHRLVDHVLDLLDLNGLITVSKTIGGGAHIFNVSPALKRMLST